MKSKFIDYVKSFVDVPKSEQDKLTSLIKIRRISKGEVYLLKGQSARTISFVNEGLFRYFYVNKKGNDLTKVFIPENFILLAYSSILEKRGAYYTIEALEDSEIEEIEFTKFDELCYNHPCWNSFLLKILQNALLIKEQREREFLMFNAGQRYASFLCKFPDLEGRIPQHFIASYIGITPETLSRLRKFR